MYFRNLVYLDMKINLTNLLKHWKIILLIIVSMQLICNLMFYFLDIEEIRINFFSFPLVIGANNISGFLSPLIIFSYLHYKKE